MPRTWHCWVKSVSIVAVLGVLAYVGRSEGGETVEAVRRGEVSHVAPTATENHSGPTSDETIDGLIVIVDCSESMAIPDVKNATQWAVSIILDAAPEGIPASLILFGHSPSIPKNLVEVVHDRHLHPISWWSKSHYRRAVYNATPSPNRVALSGALNQARADVEASSHKRVAIVAITDGQNVGEHIEVAIEKCVQMPQIESLRTIALGEQPPPGPHDWRPLFHRDKLSLGFARTPDELTDSLRPITAALGEYRKLRSHLAEAEMCNLKETLAQSNRQLEHTGGELNHRTLELAAEREAIRGLKTSEQDLTTQLAVLNTKTMDRAKHDAETILSLENRNKNHKETIEKLNDELRGLHTQVAHLAESDKSAKQAVHVRTQEAQHLQAALDKERVENQVLEAATRTLRNDLCCCVEAKRCVDAALDKAHAENHALKETVTKLRADLSCCVEAKKSLDAALDKAHAENHALRETVTKLRADLCCCVDAKKSLETSLNEAKLELAGVKADLATKLSLLEAANNALSQTKGQLTSVSTQLTVTSNTLQSTENSLAACKAKAEEDRVKLTEYHGRICCLDAALASAQQSALGATRELAAAKHDAPSAIFNTPQQQEGSNGPGGTAGGTAGGTSGERPAELPGERPAELPGERRAEVPRGRQVHSPAPAMAGATVVETVEAADWALF